MGKAAKSTKKFASSGKLKKTIQARHKHQQIKKQTQRRKTKKDPKGSSLKPTKPPSDAEEDEEDEEVKEKKEKSLKGMSVDQFLGAGFMDSEAEPELEGERSEDDAEGEDDEDDNQSFASVDDLDDEGDTHLVELSKLAEKDPEFYKYLQENDRELLNFNPSKGAEVSSDEEDEEDEGDEDEGMDVDRIPVLTKDELKKWQKGLLEQRSLRALRKLLIAFRSAAHMNEEDQNLAWSIDSSSVYNKLVTTALRYTPVVLEHHIPCRNLPNGRFKPPTQTPKFKTLQKLTLSYFHNVIHILSQLTDTEMIRLAITESAKIIPYIISSRKAVKLYLKKCLELWSNGEDSIRISAFLAMRKLASATDDSILDMVLKGTYLTLVRSSRSTSAHTLPAINLMKNSASEIYCVDHSAAYQHAFGYIRQLAIHLRNSMKVKSKEAYKQVYNWQFVHCVDFWSLVLARACDAQTQRDAGGKESQLKPLIYPLVQVSLGAIKLISNARSFPFHLQIIRSLLHLTQHTETYVPLAPYLIPILTATLSPSTKPKLSTLKPLELEAQIRAPQQYAKTRIYAEGLVEETAALLAEWLASNPVHGSIAFPEIIVPVVVSLRKVLKAPKTPSKGGSGSGKEVALLKVLLERVEESAKWMEQRRKNVAFGPGKLTEVMEWETVSKAKLGDTPLGKYVKVQRKTRERRRQLIDKARQGEDEILEDSE